MGGIGDNLIVTTVLKSLKKKYDYVEVLTKEPIHVVFENNPHIDRLSVRKTDVPCTDAASYRKWFQERAQEYDAFWDMGQSCEWAHALFTPQSAFYWSLRARRKRFAGSYLETCHDICDLDYTDIGAQFYPTEAEDKQAAETKADKFPGKKVIGWVCAGSRIDKHHPRDDMVVAQLIREIPDAMVALHGGYYERDWDVARRIEKTVRQVNGTNDRLRLCMSPTKENDIWPIRRGLTQLQHCDLVITPDTGSFWAVSQRPVPKILMVSHASPENIAKHAKNTVTLHANIERVPCWMCHRLHDDASTCVTNAYNDGAACLEDISVVAIVETAKALLAGDGDRLFDRAFTSEQILAALDGGGELPPRLTEPARPAIPTLAEAAE